MKTVAVLAVVTGTAMAQPFVHHVAEPVEAREQANDLEILTGGQVAFVGTIDRESQDFRRDGWIVVHRPDGTPTSSWMIEDNDTNEDVLLATFEDRVDKHLIVLQQGVRGFNPAANDLVLFKIDPLTGALVYQWRYPGDNAFENIGMERDGDTGLVAASVINTQGVPQCTLLRFRNATGLPIFHYRYTPVQFPAFNLQFFDVASDPETGDIFAVGRVNLDSPPFSPQSEILVARFDSFGVPIWFGAYEPFRSDTPEPNAAVGVSIELNRDGNPVVAARQFDNQLGATSVHLVIDRFTAIPSAFSANSIDNAGISPAYSSLERLNDGTMLVSGHVTRVDGQVVPAMWDFDGTVTSHNWLYMPDVVSGIGNSAIPQPGEGLLLAGRVFPNQGPIGGFSDALLARTMDNGQGLCDVSPDVREPPLQVRYLLFGVERSEVENPSLAGLEVIAGDPVRRLACEPCPADLNGDGVLNFFDVSIFLNAFNAMNPIADFNNDGVFDFFDVSAFLAAYNAGCP